jgi:EAL and modified HD-GYP domain-containing signal transduction protein
VPDRGAASEPTARFQDPDCATVDVLLKVFLEIGLPIGSPAQPVFIDHASPLLRMDPVLPAVVEALEDVTAEPEIVEAIAHLKSLGYRIALDDFVFNDSLGRCSKRRIS